MAETVKHTSGPWSWRTRPSGFLDALVGNEKDVLQAGEYAGASWIEVSDEDASLIAAAPELLEALHVVGMSAGWQYMTIESRSLVESAIAKAEGHL